MSAGQKARNSWPGAAPAAGFSMLNKAGPQDPLTQSAEGETGGETARGGFAALIPAALMLLAGMGGLTFATLLADGVEGQFVVISPPWQPAVHLVTRADGALLAEGGFSNVIVAASDRPGFADDLRKAGAWLVFPAPRALGCGSAAQISEGARAPSDRPGPRPLSQETIPKTAQQAGSL